MNSKQNKQITSQFFSY